MRDNTEISADNREKQGDKHARAESRLGDRKNFAPVRHWIVESYRTVAGVTLNTLILVGCLELAAMGMFEIRSLSSRSAEQLVGEGAPREKNSYYASKGWAAQYWHEFRLSRRERYYPYVGWRRGPFKGETINIDQRGIRLTPNADCSTNAYKVFVFGGSTMWGTGSPDWGTIPAYLQTGFGVLTTRPVCVVNFGESAYVSTQSLILLLRQLQSGNVPDLVLFYDGVNDVYAAYQSGEAGVHQNLDQIASKFDGRSNKVNPFIEWLDGSSSVALVKNVIARLKQESQQGENLVTYETLKVDRANLSASVARTYVANYKVVDALAHKYGFKFVFFWQPVIVAGKKPLTNEEQTITASLDPALVALYTSVYHNIEQTASHFENLYYMGHIFDEQNSGIWIDDMHVTPAGNQIIAAKMLSTLRERGSFSG
jgi:lysophospholipase L1-like esterase